MLIVKASPGTAPGVAAALDDAGLDEVLGSIAGDDTILVITRSAADAACDRRQHRQVPRPNLARPLRSESRLTDDRLGPDARQGSRAMAKAKCVLAYSGGLDTSVAIQWIRDNYDLDVIALAIDVGQERQDLEVVRQKALEIGAVESIVKDVREEYVERVPLSKALKANALYENKYPLLSAMSRPIIVKHLVEEAHRTGATLHRPRLHRQGQRPGPLRGRHRRARPRHRGPRPGARVGPVHARAGDGLRRGARHPRAHDQGQPVLDRRQPVGPRHRVRRARGPVGRAAGGHLHDDQRCARRGVRHARVRRDLLRAGPAGRAQRRCRRRSTTSSSP